MFFTFAFNDCIRVRGNTANCIKYDEYQNLDASFEPIINQTVAASKAGLDFSDSEALEAANAPCSRADETLFLPRNLQAKRKICLLCFCTCQNMRILDNGGNVFSIFPPKNVHSVEKNEAYH